jgi:lambda repressor-like predicted transcriptional regulator
VTAGKWAWSPVHPPGRGKSTAADWADFYAHMLIPGFSLAFHAQSLRRSLPSIANYRARARAAAQSDITILAKVSATLKALTAEDGLRMAQLRGQAQMPYWSRLAVFDYRKRGMTHRELAADFGCSPRTIVNILGRKGQIYTALSGERRLTQSQMCPPGRWKPRQTDI